MMFASAPYTLINAETWNKETEGQFWIPPESDRKAIILKSMVKLRFHSEGHGEGLWVQVFSFIEADGQKKYYGHLQNSPVSVRARYGDLVEFGPEHVIDIGG